MKGNELLKLALYYLSLLLGLLLINFMLFRVIPSDPARIILGPNADISTVEKLRRDLGLDAPLHAQFIQYIGDLLRLDLGESYFTRRAILPDLMASLAVTLASTSLAVVIAVIYSIFSVYFVYLTERYSKKYLAGLNTLFVSIPCIVVAIAVGLISIQFNLFGFIKQGDMRNVMLCAIALAVYPAASLSQILLEQTTTLEKQPFIVAARSMGFSSTAVFFRKLLKNALLPWLAQLSNIIIILVSGAAVVEVIFSVPGMGRMLFRAILSRDLPVLQGLLVIVTVCFVLINTVLELLYSRLNPRKTVSV